MTFKKGDRVRYTGPRTELVGRIGSVVESHGMERDGILAVLFDTVTEPCRTCGHEVQAHFWLPATRLAPVQEVLL